MIAFVRRAAPLGAAMFTGAMLVLAGASFAGGSRMPVGYGASLGVRHENIDGLVDIARRLDTRERALARREAGEADRQADLTAIEARLQAKLDALEKTRGEILTLLDGADAARTARVDALVGIVQGMKPAEAAAMMLDVDPDLAVEVLAQMDGPKASKVLAAMPPKESAALADRMVRDPLAKRDGT